ncbi:MAG: 5-formyltetrahydrofolate cyclo-ligase [Ilumatobacter sp.]|jgi:5-formyltetrahydrofolate cyclo-ligase
MEMPNEGPGVVEAKRTLRRSMRALRMALPDRVERSAQITRHLVELDIIAQASRVLAYSSVLGEVETEEFIAWCRSHDIEVALPEDDGLDPAWPDVIVVPGTAFTARGERIGQGGGWYDRFLPGRRADAVTIGIGFEPQLVDSLPTEPHDVILDCIVTDDGAIWPHG